MNERSVHLGFRLRTKSARHRSSGGPIRAETGDHCAGRAICLNSLETLISGSAPFVHTEHVPSSRQYELTLRAVSSLDQAVMLLLATDPPEPKAQSWTLELTDLVVEGIRASRWFVAKGFEPPGKFGSWLRKNLKESELQSSSPHGDLFGAAVWMAAAAVDHLPEEWQPGWSF